VFFVNLRIATSGSHKEHEENSAKDTTIYCRFLGEGPNLTI
jgi:hypothetical protein